MESASVQPWRPSLGRGLACSDLQGPDRGDQLVDRRSVIRPVTPKGPGQGPIGGDDEVAPQLEGVLGRAPQIPETSRTDELQVPGERPDAPHPPNRSPPEPEGPVGRSIGIEETPERHVVDPLRALEVAGAGEGHEHDLGIGPQFGDPCADGDGMSGAGQSMDVAVEDQDHRSTALVGQGPGPTVDVDQFDVGCGVAGLNGQPSTCLTAPSYWPPSSLVSVSVARFLSA